MYILKLQLISIALGVVLFIYLQWQVYLKRLFRIPNHEFRKPFDCFTCTLFWIGQLVGMVLLPDWQSFIYLTLANITTSYAIGKL